MIPNRRFVYSWKGGHPSNDRRYVSELDTIVTFVLEEADGGMRLRVVHSGFVAARNDPAYRCMSEGWLQVVQTIGKIVDQDET